MKKQETSEGENGAEAEETLEKAGGIWVDLEKNLLVQADNIPKI